ncbi:hypothetical protein BS78_06G165600 [Paspalum vaginatum]|nr:hypothetical protein BS78_06G165600 [Paspalum vaginatum]
MSHSMATQSFPSQQVEKEAEAEAETNPELYEHFANLVSSLPSSDGMSRLPLHRHEQGWYLHKMAMVGAMVADACFAARPSDILVATAPKAGTTWLKALLYATVHRREHPADAADHPFNSLGPHECVKFLEMQLFTGDRIPNLDKLPDPRLFSTHLPFVALPKSVVSSGCKILYVCREPKDNLISMWQMANKAKAKHGVEPMPIEAAVEFFCDGLMPFGPYWDHVLGYWRAHLAHPDRVLFFKYEEIQRDPAAHVRKLAEFVGCPFGGAEDDDAVDAIVRICSFDHLSGLEVTKRGETNLGAVGHVDNTTFFRRGGVGDWANHISPEMARRIDAITAAKFKDSGLSV